MRVLVTGSAGFIGSTVSHRLLDRGDEVVGLDNFNSYYDVSLKEARAERLRARTGYCEIRASLEDREALSALFATHAIDRVVHLAAQAGVRYSLENPHAYIDANLIGFMNILEGCRHAEVEHLVYASSSSVYGANESLPFRVEDSVDHPVSLYAATKKANELMAHTYSHLFGLPTTGLRFFTVYGPWGRPDMALFKFTRAILTGQPVQLFNGGHHRRDFTFISDIVDGVIGTLDQVATPDASFDPMHPNPGTARAPWRVYNIGSNRPVDLIRYLELIEDACGQKAQIESLPMQAGDVEATHADVSALQRAIGYAPRVAVEQGIPQFVAWYRDYYQL
ncbi:MAG: NAD-dependent epimerase [Litorivicinaceae bacterium]|jgi:UDP-glucuronate 4-epimerase|nr:NAD-dependent epimerase [Litorivicinaceae bacterium]MDP5328818.1 NAD-dependent epimerase [Litorivicinaceae bacterium]MDP5330066.1 NAD-dependent epimerase [Litorivicinaceae bacterium]MDP5341669.1 NAD-dependent epimerase [Litorivicinaceae bacterium]MDP5343344.1 NAD-dependent epimerase [Litorivicinaceae bacterium]